MINNNVHVFSSTKTRFYSVCYFSFTLTDILLVLFHVWICKSLYLGSPKAQFKSNTKEFHVNLRAIFREINDTKEEISQKYKKIDTFSTDIRVFEYLARAPVFWLVQVLGPVTCSCTPGVKIQYFQVTLRIDRKQSC